MDDEMKFGYAKFFAVVMASIVNLVFLLPVCWVAYFFMYEFFATSDLIAALTSLVVTACVMLKMENIETYGNLFEVVRRIEDIKNTLGRIEVKLNKSKID